MLGIVSAKEAVFDEIAHGLAMGTLRKRQSRKIASALKPNRLQIRQNRGGVKAGYDV